MSHLRSRLTREPLGPGQRSPGALQLAAAEKAGLRVWRCLQLVLCLIDGELHIRDDIFDYLQVTFSTLALSARPWIDSRCVQRKGRLLTGRALAGEESVGTRLLLGEPCAAWHDSGFGAASA